MVGTARLRIVLSSTGMATETITIDAANQRRGSSWSSAVLGAIPSIMPGRKSRQAVRCPRMSEHAVRLSHLGLCVADMDRSLHFYCDGLGFTVAEGYDLDDGMLSGIDRALEVRGPVQL